MASIFVTPASCKYAPILIKLKRAAEICQQLEILGT